MVARIASWPSRLSLPARVAWTLAAFLVLTVVLVWMWFLISPTNVPWRHALTLGRVLGVMGLVVVTPLVVYRGLKYWLEGDIAEFPDIDFAWKSGLQALDESGIPLESTPIFLFLGAGSEQQEEAIVHAAGCGLRVRGAPVGPAPLHWYGSPQGVFLFSSGASRLSAVARMVERKAGAGRAAALTVELPAFGASVPQQPPRAAPTEVSTATPAAPPRAQPAAEASVRGTISLGQFVTSQAPREVAPPKAAPPTADAGHRGTMVLSAPVTAPPAGAAPSVRQAASPGAAPPAVLSTPDAHEQTRRMQYVCALLARVRHPTCAVNGIVALVPFESVQATTREAEDLTRAVRADLTTALDQLRVRCPVTVLFTGLERERGFSELVRRVGRERAAIQRFGRGFDVTVSATREELAAFTLHVCGAFEDWIYTLFREDGALTRPGNTHLYGLLCRVRCNLKQRLTDLLADGLGFDPDRDPEQRLLVSGCYFAATGTSEDRQAFVKSVFDKLEEEQDAVEWTDSARFQDRRWRAFTVLGATLAVLLLAALAVMIVLHFS